MDASEDRNRLLQTELGAFPLHEYRLRLAGHEWGILHTHATISHADEARYFRELRNRLPYGVALWPAAIALAHELASRGDSLRERSLLELGAGTGLPGIVAAAFGAQVVQSDRHEQALAICRRNGARNGAHGIVYRLGDWAAWQETARYEWLIGADILYSEALHPQLRQIFETNLAPGGRVLLADPFRDASLRFLEQLERDGWAIVVSTWSIGDDETPRTVGLFELTPPQ